MEPWFLQKRAPTIVKHVLCALSQSQLSIFTKAVIGQGFYIFMPQSYTFRSFDGTLILLKSPGLGFWHNREKDSL